MAWEERGSCLNIFQTTNRGQISETFTNYETKRVLAQVSETRPFALYFRTGVVLMHQLESSWHQSSVAHVLTYSGGKIMVGSLKPSRIMRQNTCYAIIMAWEDLGSCLSIFRTKNRGRIKETFTNYKAKYLLRK
ncbi:uncharacterized protein G2W53_026463 [Senna tora]|uniref:Uncharacterized protein n=1 Tax=Senna tora TaxID=362788 RepID=A0A834TF21_9FABA|nr:uncharacterized protein G2W53_026463 [Senna tora]